MMHFKGSMSQKELMDLVLNLQSRVTSLETELESYTQVVEKVKSLEDQLKHSNIHGRRNSTGADQDQVPKQNPNLLTKTVDPASRLLYAAANKLFGVVFGLSLRPSEINEEPQHVPPEEGQRGNSASISAATGISDLEQMLQQKTFTRSEFERLTALLHSRTNESSSADVVQRDGANLYSSPSSLLRLEASTSGSLKKHVDERDNLHAAISTPLVTSRALLEKVDSPRLLSYPHDNQKSEVQHHERLHDSRELTSKGKEKVEDNGPRKFPIPRNMMSSVNGELSVTSKDKAPDVRINDSPLKLPAEPPQKKHTFEMSAPEDDSFEIDDDDDDETQVNGHVSLPLVESNKQETALAADIVATSTLPGVSRTPELVENNKQMFPEAVKVIEQAEPKESEKPVSSPKIDVGFGGSVSEQGLGFKLPASPPLTTNSQNNLLPQATLQMDYVVPEKDSSTSAERVSPFAFSANGLSDSKSSASSNPKALESTSVSNSVTTNGHAKLTESNKVENGNDQKSANIFGKSESKDGNGNDQKAANIFGNLDAPASTGDTLSALVLEFGTGASSSGGSTGFAFGTGTTSSFSTPTQNQSPFGNPTRVFGTPTPVFGTGATPNNNDHMSMDSMAEDSMQTPTPVPAFGQTPVAAPGFMFGSTTPTPSPAMPSFQFGGQPNQAPSQIPTPASASFQFGGQPNQAPSQNPIPASASFQFGGQTNQAQPQNPFHSSSAKFNAGGGSFSLGSNGGDKSNRRIVRFSKSINRRK